jgi:hypothetical protein
MRNLLGIGLAFAAISGCAGGPPPATTSSTQGTTVVRTAVITGVTPSTGADSPTRLALRYDNGAREMVEVTTSEVFKVGEKVRVTHARGTERIERLDTDGAGR